MTDHAELARIAKEARIAAATVHPAGDSWIRGYAEDVPKLLAALDALEAALAAGERERQQLRNALAAMRAKYDHSQEDCLGQCLAERAAVVADLDAVLAGEGDATPPEGGATNG